MIFGVVLLGGALVILSNRPTTDNEVVTTTEQVDATAVAQLVPTEEPESTPAPTPIRETRSDDADRDGVPNDGTDQCPDVFGEAAFNGCPNPDSDGDGYPDPIDSCRFEGDAGFGVDNTGCPNPDPNTVNDDDGDGFVNANDACPTEGDSGFGVDGDGCPLAGTNTVSSIQLAQSNDIQVQVVNQSGETVGVGLLRVFHIDNVLPENTTRVELELRFVEKLITATPFSELTRLAVVPVTSTPQPMRPTATPRISRYEETSIAINQLMGASLFCSPESFSGCDEEANPDDFKIIGEGGATWSWTLRPQVTTGIHDLHIELWRIVSANNQTRTDTVWQYPFTIQIGEVAPLATPTFEAQVANEVYAAPAVAQEREFGVRSEITEYIVEEITEKVELTLTGTSTNTPTDDISMPITGNPPNAPSSNDDLLLPILLIGGTALGLVFVAFYIQQKRGARSKVSKVTVFLSYRRKTSWAVALKLRESLSKIGADVFMDMKDLRDGQFDKRLMQEIQSRQFFIVLIAPETLSSEWVVREIQFALQSDKRIIPVLTDGFQMSEENLPDDLKELSRQNGVTLTLEFYEAGIERIAQFLRLKE